LPKRIEESFKERAPLSSLNNYYGPTEASIDVTAINLSQHPTAGHEVLIGKPVDNTRIYIVNEKNALQPVGVSGEILIGGDQVARGYLNQEALTKEKFIASPFREGERIYKTGDLGKWMPDGNIEFIGRKDDQVKIRGYRIEPGEIEHALLSREEIKEAVVLAKENESGEKELVAYITSNVEQNTSDLRAYLKELLPAYMLPAYFVQLEAMPLTANGKVDKKSLPDPGGLGISGGMEYVAPRTEQEKILVSVWSAVLKRSGIGIRDSFYNLGGDSIKSIQVVARLKQQGYSLKPEHLLRTPVLEDLSHLMELTTKVTDQSEVVGEVALTPTQQWFFNATEIKVHDHFNQSVLLYSKEQINGKLLEKSIADLTRHHDALRMVYKQKEGVWQQFNQDTGSKRYIVHFYDLTGSDDAPGEMAQLGEELQSGIQLSEGPLFRVVHFRLKDGDRVGLIIHHLVVDGVSWRILLEDLSDLYSGYKEGKKPGLPLKTDSFQRWALLQKEYAAGKKLERERPYWEEVCHRQIAGLAQDKVVKEGHAAVIDSVEFFALDEQTTELLQTRVNRVYNTEINDVLLTSLGLALKEVLSADKSVLRMEGHGREEIIDGIDISRTVGWFTTFYPFVLDVSISSDQTANLISVKESLRRIPGRGIGYGILTHLSREGLETKLTPEIIFNYLGDFGVNVSNDDGSLFEYASEHIGSNVSKANATHAILDVSGMLVKGKLGMSIRYSGSRYDAATIQKLSESYKKNLQSLIETLSKNNQTYLTPSDLSFKGLSQQELSKLNPDNTLEDVYGLSPLQEGIYYHWLAEDSSTLFFQQVSCRVRAKGLAIEKLKEAYDRLTARHAVLRTSFSMEYAGRSLQLIRKEVPSNFTYEKLDSLADPGAQVALIRLQDRQRGFDLGSGTQMRLHVIDLSQGVYEFIWSYHHILMDGWCMSVLINDFNQLLSAAIKDITVDLPQIMPYSNYINWLQAIDRESSLHYWKEYLSGYSSMAEIPFKVETTDSDYVESSEHLQIGGDLFKKVDELCIGLGITHNTFVQGVWGYLLSRYNNTNDVVFGAVVSGRPADLAGVEDMIGLFSNTIPVRVQYDPHDTPVKLLKSLQEQSIRSTSHHYMNLAEVQSQSELGMDLMTHIMIFENYAVKETESEGAVNSNGEEVLSIQSTEVIDQSNYDFNIAIAPSPVSLHIGIRYNTNRYSATGLKRLINHLGKLVNEFVQNADQPLSTFDYLSKEERHQLLVTFNDTAVAYPKDKTIVDLFEEQAAKTPDNIAIVFGEKQLTYRELNERSDQLAGYLQKNYDIQPDDLIGIHLNRSEWMIVSILGVLKSGGAYVPIDPEYPSSRKEYIVKDSAIDLLITEATFIYDIDFYDGEVFAIDVEFDSANYQSEALQKLYTAGNLAYVIYTSGSTGDPKGVMIEHRSYLNMVLDQIKTFGINAHDKVLQFASSSFDVSVLEIFMPLYVGAQLVLIKKEQIHQENEFVAYLNSKQVSVMAMTPSYLETLAIQQLSFLRIIITGGESLSVEKAIECASVADYYNEYGPTEYSVCTSIYKVDKKDRSKTSIPIGRPIANTQLYIVDSSMNLVAQGVVGEICISGAGLARGYVNLPELTAGTFIDNPFVAGERLYKTGDLGYWLADGNIEFVGRTDDQVKIRGYRIEPGEIEHALLKHGEIDQAVVVAKENQAGEKELVAYITSGAEQNIGELRAFLKLTMPVYMLPAYFVQLETMPLTANGKIDKKLLPNPEGLGLTRGVAYVAPGNELEEKLVKIWEEVLQREKIGILDNFFDLGMDSLKTMRLVTLIHQKLNIDLRIADILENTNIQDIAKKIVLIEDIAKLELENKSVTYKNKIEI
jgi:amino acid adenylation domain-containing protein/non-ribosomal peptide synthase protein (TIGR01720 family)